MRRLRAQPPILVLTAIALLAAGLSFVAAGPASARTKARAKGPVVTNVTPNAGSTSGGKYVTITGRRFTKDSRVHFGAVAVRPSQASATRLLVRAPKHSRGQVHVRVLTERGTSPSELRNRYWYVAAPGQLTVSARTTMMPESGVNKSMSCPTATFCMIVDRDAAGAAVSFDGTREGTPTPLGIGPLTAVSCSSPSWCVAVGATQARSYDGTGWGPAQLLPGASGLAGVSCTSEQFCVAVGADAAYRFDGTSWTTAQLRAGSRDMAGVSCVSTAFCLAVEAGDPDFGGGHSFVFDGTSWRDAGTFLDDGAASSVSCASTTYCVAVSTQDLGAVFDGGAWQKEHTFAAFTSTVSCAAGPLCVVVGDGGGATFVSHGAGWTKLSLGGHAGSYPEGLSCSSATLCRTVTDDGHAFAFDGTAWHAGAQGIDTQRGAVVAIACASGSFCVAVDRYGWASTYNGKAWSDPVLVDPSGHLTAVACPRATGATYCMAVDDRGRAVRFTKTSWDRPVHADSKGAFTAISCPTTRWCIAVDDHGYAVKYSGLSWHAPRKLLAHGKLTAISCPSTAFCYAAGTGGQLARYRLGWQHRQTLGKADYTAISCDGPAHCLVASANGQVRTYTGRPWSHDTAVPGPHPGEVDSISCVSRTFCALTADVLVTLRGNVPAWQRASHTTSETVSCWAANRCMVGGWQYAYTVRS